MGLIRTLLIIVVIYYVIRFIGRFLLPIILKKFINSTQQNMQDWMKDFYTQQKQEGEVTIDYPSQKENKKNKNQDGEYVDYEEVK